MAAPPRGTPRATWCVAGGERRPRGLGPGGGEEGRGGVTWTGPNRKQKRKSKEKEGAKKRREGRGKSVAKEEWDRVDE